MQKSECMTSFDDAHQTGFVLRLEKSPEFTYNTQNVSFPSVTVSSIETPYRNAKAYLPDNVVQYDPLTITFVVDENFKNYNYLYKQMLSYAQKKDSNKIKDVFDTIHIFRLDNAKKPIADIAFIDGFCTDLSSLEYSVNVSDDDIIVCTATFRYQTFEIREL